MAKYATQNGIRKVHEKIRETETLLSETQRRMGDATSQSSETWHDNAPFEVLREDVAILDRILRDKLSAVAGCQIREYPAQVPGGVVDYGADVVIIRDGAEFNYKLVGYGDEDSDKNRIRYDLPLAQVLMGKSIGQKFTADVNGRRSRIEIREASAIIDEDLVDHRY